VLSIAKQHAVKFLCMCQLDSARVSEFRSTKRFRTPDTRDRTTGYEPGHFADLSNSTQIAASSTPSRRSTDRQTRHIYRHQDGLIDGDLKSEVCWYGLQ
jgi:hypothetical protein